MANPLEQIRQGILARNWTLVVEGFGAMTGEKLAVPKNSFETETEELRQIIADIARMSCEAINIDWNADDDDERHHQVVQSDDTDESEEGDDWEPEFVEADESDDDPDDEEMQAAIRASQRQGRKKNSLREKTQVTDDDDDIDDDLMPFIRKLDGVTQGAKAPIPRPAPASVSVVCDACRQEVSVLKALAPPVVDGKRVPWKCPRCKDRHGKSIASSRK